MAKIKHKINIKTMEIFVIGQCTLHWGRMEYGNIGNYYIIEPFFRELHRVFPTATIKTTFQMTEDFCQRENIKCVPMEYYYSWQPQDLDVAYKELSIATIYLETGEIIETTPYIREVLSSDLIIDFSGDIWGKNADLVGENRFLIGLLKDRVAQLFNKPTAMLAGSPGPFSNDKTLNFARLVFDKFDLVTNREEISNDVLKSFGFDTSKVYSLACPAFEFEPAPQEQIKPLIQESFLAHIGGVKRPVIGFLLCGWNMIQGPFNRTDWKDSEFTQYVDLIKHMIHKYDVDFCLMSHSNGFNLPPDFKLKQGRDFPIMKQIYSILEKTDVKEHIYLFEGIYTPAETKAIIGNFDMVISGRVHAAVAALSQNIPTTIIDYGHEPKAHKLVGFAKLAGVENLVADPNSIEDLINKSEYCFENKEIIHKNLINNNIEIKKKIKLNFDLLKNIVKNK